MDETHTDGAGAIAAYDQKHAEAIQLLSRARAFLLVVDEGKGGFSSAAAAIGASAAEFLASAVIVASVVARQSVHDVLAATNADEEEDK
jgi:hypothetical protein